MNILVRIVDFCLIFFYLLIQLSIMSVMFLDWIFQSFLIVLICCIQLINLILMILQLYFRFIKLDLKICFWLIQLFSSWIFDFKLIFSALIIMSQLLNFRSWSLLSKFKFIVHDWKLILKSQLMLLKLSCILSKTI